jgi:hypothetical protein
MTVYTAVPPTCPFCPTGPVLNATDHATHQRDGYCHQLQVWMRCPACESTFVQWTRLEVLAKSAPSAQRRGSIRGKYTQKTADDMERWLVPVTDR